MKNFFKSLTFSFIALVLTQQLFNGFHYGYNHYQILLLIVLALAMLNLFMTGILSIVSLPTKGVAFLFISVLLNFVMLYMMTVFIPSFNITAGKTPSFNTGYFVLPSASLSSLQTGIYSAVSVSVIYGYFDWLASVKHKKK
ncbi:MAG: hypothetical protein UU80_C0040G0005 [candidate division WWE3 bacterium GW2011_GWA1_41_8]|uniref:Uncharacterized protein n=2 Tax=Katanobacteria TaxID=422282 RepID=A0A0G0X907_UNCKA|nr:MAG: hypothetical protein UU80_C0040G0005 [candidate division WWE3 bacterium GW2011_GWA1_41_8]OGC56776.1 MAG: hypothetical protein A2976_01395 [candidate division WWE3 bacterium RIFCSPLOWO2_01_FULL_41_9]